ncbi:MAG: putative metal-binding motif-containing protein [Deltaproteobacteria bacterium]|nr:putative metal-binding motif-containing protein [Deltaproteobacteria bacterium]
MSIRVLIAVSFLGVSSGCASSVTGDAGNEDARSQDAQAPSSDVGFDDARAELDAAPRTDAAPARTDASDPDASPDASDRDAGEVDSGLESDSGAALDAGGSCVDLTVFADGDGDGFGTSSQSMSACLLPGEQVAGYSREAGDCAGNDPWIHPGASEICGDFVDDDCAGAMTGAACPTTQAAVSAPAWDCSTGPAPNNVYAYALFSNGGGFFQDDGCFVFFEGLRDEFYVARKNVTAVNNSASCSTVNGCVCPSLNGWPSYDRRMYAFTLAGNTSDCPEIAINDNGNEAQPVSNACRKYLLQLHYYGLQIAYVGNSLATIDARLSLYPTVEVACAHDLPHNNLPYRTLMTAPVVRNPGFVKQ